MTEVEKLFDIERRVLLRTIAVFEEEIKKQKDDSHYELLQKELADAQATINDLQKSISSLKLVNQTYRTEIEHLKENEPKVEETSESESVHCDLLKMSESSLSRSKIIETEYGNFHPVDVLYMSLDSSKLKEAFGVDCHMPVTSHPITLKGYGDGEYKLCFCAEPSLQTDRDEMERLMSALRNYGWQDKETGFFSMEEDIVYDIVPAYKFKRSKANGNS